MLTSTHLIVGYGAGCVSYYLAPHAFQGHSVLEVGGIGALLSHFPDFDVIPHAVPGKIGHWLNRMHLYHRGVMHSAPVPPIVGAIAATLLYSNPLSATWWYLFLCFSAITGSHLFLDCIDGSKGVCLVPFSHRQYKLPWDLVVDPHFEVPKYDQRNWQFSIGMWLYALFVYLASVGKNFVIECACVASPTYALSLVMMFYSRV